MLESWILIVTHRVLNNMGVNQRTSGCLMNVVNERATGCVVDVEEGSLRISSEGSYDYAPDDVDMTI